MRGGWAGLGLIAAGVAMAVCVQSFAQTSPDTAAAGTVEQRARLSAARTQSQAAATRAARLDAAAATEKDAALKARQQEAAVAARIQQAQADMAAAQARVALTAQMLDDQRARLATQQGPIARLLAALQSIARRPAVLSVAQPGSIDDLVHVRAVLASTMPVVRTRTAAIRAEVAQTRAIQASAALAARSLDDSRHTLQDQRLVLARLETEHDLKSRALGRDALVESDRAIALGERARDLVDTMDRQGNEAAIRASLAGLPDPLPRPPRAGEVPSAIGGVAWPHDAPPYRLPVAGKLVTGLGELSDTGVRSRGLTIATAADATVVAPAAGRIAYAGPFRRYGTIVIVDHGDGWTTLVTGLGATAVRVGDQVAQGAPIGNAAGGEDPRVTIELRRRDRPIDMTALIG